MTDCPTCGRTFEQLGRHLSLSDCPYPELSDFQQDVVAGLLMGDGGIECRGGGRKPYLRVTSCEREFLEHTYDILLPHSGSVYTDTSAEYFAEFHDRDVSNFRDSYRLSTISSPEFNEFHGWYNGGSKRFPDDIHINDTILKYWYVGDGSLHPSDMMVIYSYNESDRMKLWRSYSIVLV